MKKQIISVNESSMYELRDAAELLGVSKSTIQRWSREGKLKYSIRKVNNRRVWYGSELKKCWISHV